MRKTPKILLISSIVILGLGLLDWQESYFWYALRPIGAILLLEYIIFQLLDKEVALFDEQERGKTSAVNSPAVTATVRSAASAGNRSESLVSTAQLAVEGVLQKA
jgi:hypothetical protein